MGAKVHGYFGRFEAFAARISAVGRMNPDYTESEKNALFKHAQNVVETQRFYLPGSAHVVVESETDRLDVSCVRLPYTSVMILDDTGEMFDVKGEGVGRDRLIFASQMGPESFGFWAYRIVGHNGFTRGDRGAAFWRNGRLEVEEPDGRPGSKYTVAAARSVANLCTMLSLSNVRTERLDPSPKVLKKRGSDKPLFSYHILCVDGERWDRPEQSSSSAIGVRSHLRRGHVRRLDADRRVWVRACFVRGAVAGFVHKDYALGVAA